MEKPQARTTLSWAVKEIDGSAQRVTTSYAVWKTQEEAIEGYCKQTGKSWEQLTKEGATLVQVPVVVFDNPGTQDPT